MDDMDQRDSGNEFDYNSVFGGAAPTDEGDRKVSGKTVPSFPLYVVHVGGAKEGYSRQKGTPFVRPWMLIKEGPDGTVGDLVSDDLYLSVSKTTNVDGIDEVKSPEKFKDDATALVRKLNRIARIGGFPCAKPTGFDKESLGGYASQFSGLGGQGFDAIIEIRETTEEYESVKRTRNRIIWESMAALTDEADAKKLKGKTALEEARLKIAERNAAAAKRAGGAKSGTAGATSRANPEALFN